MAPTHICSSARARVLALKLEDRTVDSVFVRVLLDSWTLLGDHREVQRGARMRASK